MTNLNGSLNSTETPLPAEEGGQGMFKIPQFQRIKANYVAEQSYTFTPHTKIALCRPHTSEPTQN